MCEFGRKWKKNGATPDSGVPHHGNRSAFAVTGNAPNAK